MFALISVTAVTTDYAVTAVSADTAVTAMFTLGWCDLCFKFVVFIVLQITIHSNKHQSGLMMSELSEGMM